MAPDVREINAHGMRFLISNVALKLVDKRLLTKLMTDY